MKFLVESRKRYRADLADAEARTIWRGFAAEAPRERESDAAAAIASNHPTTPNGGSREPSFREPRAHVVKQDSYLGKCRRAQRWRPAVAQRVKRRDVDGR